MHPYPHVYTATANGHQRGSVTVGAPALSSFETAAPPQFDGPEGSWSPETLLCASLADCFVLTFRAVSRAARLEWLGLSCRVEGVLERVDHVSRFTRFTTFATLEVVAGADEAKARDLLERAEKGCLIANSLQAARTLETQVIVPNSSVSGQSGSPETHSAGVQVNKV